MNHTLRRTAFVTAVVLAASLVTTPAFAADRPPKVFAHTAQHYVSGVTPVTFNPGRGEDMSAVTCLTLLANDRNVGTDTAAPWGIDWDTTGFEGLVVLSTLVATAGGAQATDGTQVTVDHQAPTGLTVRFPRTNGYLGQGGELAVNATDDIYVLGSELLVGGTVVSSKDLTGGGNLDLPWNVKVPNGRTTMTVRVRDQAGNVTAQTRTVTVDNDRPVIAGSTVAGVVRGTFKVTLSGYRDAGPLAGFEVSLDSPKRGITFGARSSRMAVIDSRTVPDGRYTVGWHAFDAAGNEAVLKRSLTVDNKAPTVSISKAPRNKAKVKKKFTVTAKASDTYGIAKVQLLINGKVAQTDTKAGYSFRVNPKKYGKKFTVRVRAYDKAGNSRNSPTRTYQR